MAALIEYVFPPFPGDSVVLMGGIYAARGQRPWPLVLLAVTVGSVLGAAIDYWIGMRIARRLEQGGANPAALEQRLFRLKQVHDQMQRRGALLLLVNRFLPGIRALVFFAAGAGGMPLRKVLGWGTASAVLFNGAVLAVGFALGGNAERLQYVFARYQVAVYTLLALGVLALGVRWLANRQRSPSPVEKP